MDFYTQKEQPLFDKVIWAQPQRLDQQARVLIVGGHSHALQAPLTAFRHLKKHNLQISVVLPDSLKAIFQSQKSKDLAISFCPSTPSGSLAWMGREKITSLAAKHNCLFIAGNLSSNQETERLILELLKDFKGCKLVAGKIIKIILEKTDAITENLTLVMQSSQLPALSHLSTNKVNYNAQMQPELFARFLVGLKIKFNLVAHHRQVLWIRVGKQVCATFTSGFEGSTDDFSRLAAASTAYLVNNPQNDWQALVSAIWQTRLNAE